MNGNTIPRLLARLIDLICAAYTEFEFTEFLAIEVEEFDYTKEAAGKTYLERVFSTLYWVQRREEAAGVLRLARLVAAKRERHDDLKQLVRDLEALVVPGGPGGAASPVAKPAADGGGAAEPTLPEEILTPLGLFEEKLTSLRQLARDLRSLPLEKYDLPARFHLSDSAGKRLAAVLALEKRPQVEYLRWLSERVTVEKPYAGYAAVQALTSTARRLDREHLPRLKAAVRDAAERLDGLTDLGEALDGADTRSDKTVNVAARKRLILVVEEVQEMREGGALGLPPTTFEQFLAALVDSFDRETLDRLCRKHLEMPLKRLTNLEDPFEHIVISVVVTAHQRDGWDRELIQGAFRENSLNPTFAAVYHKYGAPAGAAV